MARRDASGAEKGSTTELNSTTNTLIGAFASDTTQARSGSRAWHASLLGAATVLDTAFGSMTAPGTAPTTYSRFFAFWVDAQTGLALGSPDLTIFRLRHGAADGDINGRFDWAQGAATGTFTIRATDTVTTQTLTFSNVKTGFWNLCQVRCTINTGALATDSWSVRLNGVEQTGTAVNFASAGHASFDFGILGQNNALAIATDLDVFFDDIILDDVSSAFQIPDASFLSFHEPGSDTTAAWGTGGAGVDHAFRLLDESDTTYIVSTTNNQTDEHTLSNFTALVDDTSGNNRDGAIVGSVPPTFGASGMLLDGVDRDDLTSGVNCGVTGFGVSTADGSMKVKATIRRSRTGVGEVIAAKEDAVTLANINYGFFIDASGFLTFRVANSVGSIVTAVGTTALLSGVDYDVEGEWIGTALNVKLGGVQQGTTPAVAALQAPNATTPLTIGRFAFNSGDPSSPYPFQGTIKNLEMYSGGVLQGQYALTSAIDGLPTSFLTIPAVYLSTRDIQEGAVAGGYTARFVEGANLGTTAAGTTQAAATTKRSLRVDANSPSGAAWTSALLNNTSERFVSVITLGQGSRITESWVYAEVQVKINLDDPIAETDAVTSINVDVILNDAVAIAEATAIKATVALNDALALADTVASINVDVSLNEALTLLDEAGNLIYLPGGGGGGTRKRYVPVVEE